MNKPVATKSDGKITLEDIRNHLAKFGKEIPHVLPMTSGVEERPVEPEPTAAPKREEKTSSPGLAPLDTSGLQQALIHNPRDVNSPY